MSAPPEPSPQDLQAEAVARDIASDMPSPYCPGRSIASCPSQAARELEDDILVLAQQGKDREEIETVLVARFGEEKMGQSTQSEVLVGIILAAVLALIAIVYFARRWLRPTPATAAGAATVPGESDQDEALAGKVSADELDRLEDELDELDGI